MTGLEKHADNPYRHKYEPDEFKVCPSPRMDQVPPPLIDEYYELLRKGEQPIPIIVKDPSRDPAHDWYKLHDMIVLTDNPGADPSSAIRVSELSKHGQIDAYTLGQRTQATWDVKIAGDKNVTMTAELAMQFDQRHNVTGTYISTLTGRLDDHLFDPTIYIQSYIQPRRPIARLPHRHIQGSLAKHAHSRRLPDG